MTRHGCHRPEDNHLERGLLHLHGMVDLLHVWEETEADILGLLWCAHAKCGIHLVHCESPNL